MSYRGSRPRRGEAASMGPLLSSCRGAGAPVARALVPDKADRRAAAAHTPSDEATESSPPSSQSPSPHAVGMLRDRRDSRLSSLGVGGGRRLSSAAPCAAALLRQRCGSPTAAATAPRPPAQPTWPTGHRPLAGGRAPPRRARPEVGCRAPQRRVEAAALNRRKWAGHRPLLWAGGRTADVPPVLGWTRRHRRRCRCRHRPPHVRADAAPQERQPGATPHTPYSMPCVGGASIAATRRTQHP